jgi:hypothetical protein
MVTTNTHGMADARAGGEAARTAGERTAAGPAADAARTALDAVRIEERVVRLGDLRVFTDGDRPGQTRWPDEALSTAAAGRRGAARDGRTTRALVDIDGEHCRVTDRFWKSIFTRYRFGASTFRYFHPQEVFARIRDVSRSDTLRVAIERRGGRPPTALAASRPDGRAVTIDEVGEIARTHGGSGASYAEGMVTCTFTPRSGEKALAIGHDDFANRFTLDVPIDGFGLPRIHVALLRLVCENGAVAMHRVFASDIPASRNPLHTLRRAVECFDHGDGFAAIRERFAAAQTSWASVREAHSLHRAICKMKTTAGAARTRLLEDFDRVTGRIQEFYGLTNVDTLPVRRQRLLPVKCRVYDLLNFASEVATHVAAQDDVRPLQSWIGTRLADEFDLEGTAGQVPEFADLLVRETLERTRP